MSAGMIARGKCSGTRIRRIVLTASFRPVRIPGSYMHRWVERVRGTSVIELAAQVDERRMGLLIKNDR